MAEDTCAVGMSRRRQVPGDEYVDRAMVGADEFNRKFQRLVTQYCWGEAWGKQLVEEQEFGVECAGEPGQECEEADGRIAIDEQSGVAFPDATADTENAIVTKIPGRLSHRTPVLI